MASLSSLLMVMHFSREATIGAWDRTWSDTEEVSMSLIRSVSRESNLENNWGGASIWPAIPSGSSFTVGDKKCSSRVRRGNMVIDLPWSLDWNCEVKFERKVAGSEVLIVA